MSDVEKMFFCGPESSERRKDTAARDVGGCLEPDKDEKGDDSDADSWADTRGEKMAERRSENKENERKLAS